MVLFGSALFGSTPWGGREMVAPRRDDRVGLAGIVLFILPCLVACRYE